MNRPNCNRPLRIASPIASQIAGLKELDITDCRTLHCLVSHFSLPSVVQLNLEF
jgi:hypothetical protein